LPHGSIAAANFPQSSTSAAHYFMPSLPALALHQTLYDQFWQQIMGNWAWGRGNPQRIIFIAWERRMVFPKKIKTDSVFGWSDANLPLHSSPKYAFSNTLNNLP
jgi:hypothetical protein